MAATSLEQFSQSCCDTIERLYSTSNAATWRVSRTSFTAALWKSFERRFGADAVAVPRAEAEQFLDSLHAADLALALGCRDGDADAWRHLVATYRAPVDAFARVVLGNSPRASEIADSLWADLFGLRYSGAERRSPLEHYGGRSSLMSWLRVVVTRLEADEWRATRRMEALDEDRDGNSRTLASNGDSADSPDPDRVKLIAALEQSLSAALDALA